MLRLVRLRVLQLLGLLVVQLHWQGLIGLLVGMLVGLLVRLLIGLLVGLLVRLLIGLLVGVLVGLLIGLGLLVRHLLLGHLREASGLHESISCRCTIVRVPLVRVRAWHGIHLLFFSVGPGLGPSPLWLFLSPSSLGLLLEILLPLGILKSDNLFALSVLGFGWNKEKSKVSI